MSSDPVTRSWIIFDINRILLLSSVYSSIPRFLVHGLLKCILKYEYVCAGPANRNRDAEFLINAKFTQTLKIIKIQKYIQERKILCPIISGQQNRMKPKSCHNISQPTLNITNLANNVLGKHLSVQQHTPAGNSTTGLTPPCKTKSVNLITYLGHKIYNFIKKN